MKPAERSLHGLGRRQRYIRKMPAIALVEAPIGRRASRQILEAVDLFISYLLGVLVPQR